MAEIYLKSYEDGREMKLPVGESILGTKTVILNWDTSNASRRNVVLSVSEGGEITISTKDIGPCYYKEQSEDSSEKLEANSTRTLLPGNSISFFKDSDFFEINVKAKNEILEDYEHSEEEKDDDDDDDDEEEEEWKLENEEEDDEDDEEDEEEEDDEEDEEEEDEEEEETPSLYNLRGSKKNVKKDNATIDKRKQKLLANFLIREKVVLKAKLKKIGRNAIRIKYPKLEKCLFDNEVGEVTLLSAQGPTTSTFLEKASAYDPIAHCFDAHQEEISNSIRSSDKYKEGNQKPPPSIICNSESDWLEAELAAKTNDVDYPFAYYWINNAIETFNKETRGTSPLEEMREHIYPY